MIDALGAIGPAARFAVPQLQDLLIAKDQGIITAGTRLRAAAALVRITRKRHPGLEILGEMLTNESSHVRSETLTMLGILGPDAASLSGDILDRLEDEDSEVREAAARALAEIGTMEDQVGQALAEATRDSDMFVAAAAVEALSEIVHCPDEAFLDMAFDASYRHREDNSFFVIRGEFAEAMRHASGCDILLDYLEARFHHGTKTEQYEVVALINALELSSGYEKRVLCDLLETANPTVRELIGKRIEKLARLNAWGVSKQAPKTNSENDAPPQGTNIHK